MFSDHLLLTTKDYRNQGVVVNDRSHNISKSFKPKIIRIHTLNKILPALIKYVLEIIMLLTCKIHDVFFL